MVEISTVNIVNFFTEWLVGHGPRVLLILLVAMAINSFIKSAVSKKDFGLVLGKTAKTGLASQISEEQRKRILTIIGAVSGTAAYLVYIIAALMILPEFGVDIAPILTGLGLIGLAFSMAAREILTDFLAGFFIILEEGFNIGDKVEIAGVKGKIEAMSFRRTTVRGDDGRVHYVRNNEIKVISRIP